MGGCPSTTAVESNSRAFSRTLGILGAVLASQFSSSRISAILCRPELQSHFGDPE